MNLINSKVDSRLNVLSIIGPASVILPVLLLIIKESPFYIDIAVTSFVCLLICSRYRIKGLGFASVLLFLVLSYDFIIDGTRLTLWDIGLTLSLQLSFVITALASAELKEAFQLACKAATSTALFEIEEWKNKIKDVILGKEVLSQEVEVLKAKLLPLQDGMKDKTEQAEMFERLLGMARNELVEQAAKRQHFEELYLSIKNAISRIEADAKEEEEILKAQNLRLESELQSTRVSLNEKDRLYHQQSINLMDAELKIEGLQEEFEFEKIKIDSEIKLYKSEIATLNDKAENVLCEQKAMASEANEKTEILGQQLENLIDRLKNLQSEKEGLEKALGDALNEKAPIKEGKELKRVWGLHDQLRSQFNEKCQTLELTRRQLFLIQEELLTLQKSISFEEEEIYNAYEAHIVKLSETITQLEEENLHYLQINH